MPRPQPQAAPPAATIPPPQAAPAPAPAPVSAAAAATATELYAAALRARVQANLAVPASVRLMGIGGITRLAIDLDPAGTLRGVSVAKSSGNAAIDAAALRSVQTSRFPPFAAEMPQHPLTFMLTVRLSP